jgi:hypothetical protein
MRDFMRILPFAGALALMSGCVPAAAPDPVYGYSAQDISKLSNGILTPDVLRNDAQCQRSTQIINNPTSTPAERRGATTAGRANGCPGF